MKQETFSPVLMTLLIVVLIYLAFTQFCLPEVVPVGASSDQFSAGRALELLAPLVRQTQSFPSEIMYL